MKYLLILVVLALFAFIGCGQDNVCEPPTCGDVIVHLEELTIDKAGDGGSQDPEFQMCGHRGDCGTGSPYPGTCTKEAGHEPPHTYWCYDIFDSLYLFDAMEEGPNP